MAWYPFVFIALGAGIGFLKPSGRISTLAEPAGNAALITLMLTIGMNIGASNTVLKSIGVIGLQCAVITVCAFALSVAAVFALEKTILPLNTLRESILSAGMGPALETVEPEVKTFPFIRIIPASLALGVILGLYLPQNWGAVTDMVFTASLMALYISTGIGLARNRRAFACIKLLGWKIMLIPIGIILGSAAGGIASGLMLGIPLHIPLLSACGMSYYSLTGAHMTQVYGIDAGVYGFLVNLLRELFSVLLLPFLARLSKGAAMAGGGAANMDTLLVPVTKFVGEELSLAVLITGTVLTFAVPVLLQLLTDIVF